jgi:hypothetical protein
VTAFSRAVGRWNGAGVSSVEFADDGPSSVALESDGLVASHSFDAGFGRSRFDGCWQGMSGEDIQFEVELDER